MQDGILIECNCDRFLLIERRRVYFALLLIDLDHGHADSLECARDNLFGNETARIGAFVTQRSQLIANMHVT